MERKPPRPTNSEVMGSTHQFLYFESMQTGPAQQNLEPKAKILYGTFLYVNIN